MKLLKLQSESRRLVLEYRNQDRILQSEVFEEAWSKATKSQRDEVCLLANIPNVNFVKQWIKDIIETGFQKLTVKELRRLASYYHIPKYSRLLKDQLVEELKKHDAKETAKRHEATPISSENTS